MGRLTEILDFLNIKPLPLEYERDFRYTNIDIENKINLRRAQYTKNGTTE